MRTFHEKYIMYVTEVLYAPDKGVTLNVKLIKSTKWEKKEIKLNVPMYGRLFGTEKESSVPVHFTLGRSQFNVSSKDLLRTVKENYTVIRYLNFSVRGRRYFV